MIRAAFGGENIESLEARLDLVNFGRMAREHQHIHNIHAGVFALARGARGDLDAAHEGRRAQDEDIAAGFFGESILWAELGIALASASRGAVVDARPHATAGRRWQDAHGWVTDEVGVVLAVIDAVAAADQGDQEGAAGLLDRALSSPSVLTGLLGTSQAVRRLTRRPADGADREAARDGQDRTSHREGSVSASSWDAKSRMADPEGGV